MNGDNDLSHIEVVLTDFGLAGPDSKGGTPIFASPECLASRERKNKSSDIFSLGRVFLFVILPTEKFLEFLFVSLFRGEKERIMETIENEPILNIISKMIRIKKRIDVLNIRKELRAVNQFRNWDIFDKISKEVEKSTSEYTTQYIDNLKHFS